ncbi:MAG: YceI family protein [Opitutaceae bacterium]|nr:YceI family protein [Cytophagales bacterium]
MKILNIFLCCLVEVMLVTDIYAQKPLRATFSKVSFFSHTPVEDIEALSDKVSSVINPSTNQIAFVILNTSFHFSNSLMEEHFNEKYMESDKYPKSSFSGKINEPINWAQNGENKVSVTGKLLVHGIEKKRTIPATITVKDGKIYASSEFLIKTEDHKIEIPKLVWEKIAEEIKVNVSTEYLAQ